MYVDYDDDNDNGNNKITLFSLFLLLKSKTIQTKIKKQAKKCYCGALTPKVFSKID